MSAIIAYDNLADRATLTASAVVSGYPVTNLQKRQLSSTCRLTPGGAITVQLSAPPPGEFAHRCRVIGLIGCALSSGAGEELVAMDVEESLDGSSWSAVDTVPALYDVAGLGLPLTTFFIPDAGYLATQWIRITPSWSGTWLSIGRLWISDAITVPDGCDSDWTMNVLDPGTLDTSSGGQAYGSPKPRLRVLSCNFTGIRSVLAYGFDDGDSSTSQRASFQGLQQLAGNTGEVVVFPRAHSALWRRRTGIYGHLERAPDIRHIAGPNYGVSLRVIEER